MKYFLSLLLVGICLLNTSCRLTNPDEDVKIDPAFKIITKDSVDGMQVYTVLHTMTYQKYMIVWTGTGVAITKM